MSNTVPYFHKIFDKKVWNYFSVICTPLQCRNCRNSLSHYFKKNRENNGFTKDLIWRNFFSVRDKFTFFHTVHEKFTATQNFFRQIKFRENNVFAKEVTNTKRWSHEIFFGESEFLVFLRCMLEKKLISRNSW